MITLKGLNKRSGFLLQNEIMLPEGITVLTGKNGSGKTRLLVSISDRNTSAVAEDGTQLNAETFLQGSFVPNFGEPYSDPAYNERRERTIEAFTQFPQAFAKWIPDSTWAMGTRGIGYQALFELCKAAREKKGKPHEELLPDDIRELYQESFTQFYGAQELSRMFNGYLKRRNDLRYAEFKKFLNSDKKTTITPDDILNIAEPSTPPWVILNEILSNILDSKFKFNEPDEQLEIYTYEASMVHCETGQKIGINELSSGEQTLLWLGLTLFNIQRADTMPMHMPNLVLLDEPDAYLHPAMVVKMYDVLKLLIERLKISIILTTHSPTTVALAPGNIYTLDNDTITLQDQDSAISSLLDGVSQISINSKNIRQVYVENGRDAKIYHRIFNRIRAHAPQIDPNISLIFLPAGRKTPENHLKDCVRLHLGIFSDQQISDFLDKVNGAGDCGQVEVAVRSLGAANNKTVRGIVDWDMQDRKREDGVTVAALNYAYTIENILFDPICLLYMLHTTDSEEFSMKTICGTEVDKQDWLKDKELLQKSVDTFIESILDRKNNNDADLIYLNKINLLTDIEYLRMPGHDLEAKVLKRYPKLNSHKNSGDLLIPITNYFISHLGFGHIPKVFADTFASTQK